MAARISAAWQAVYGHPIYFLENWVLLGRTTGAARENGRKTGLSRLKIA
jgi:hypothetical protein